MDLHGKLDIGKIEGADGLENISVTSSENQPEFYNQN